MSEAALARATTPEEKIQILTEENAKLRKENSTLDHLNDELQAEVDLFDETPLRRALEVYADPSNWTDDRFTPLMPQIDRDPYGTARSAL